MVCEKVFIYMDAARAVDALQRGQRLAREAQLAVVVVLYDISARLARPAQQRLPARHGGDDACGELVRGRDVHGLRAALIQQPRSTPPSPSGSGRQRAPERAYTCLILGYPGSSTAMRAPAPSS